MKPARGKWIVCAVLVAIIAALGLMRWKQDASDPLNNPSPGKRIDRFVKEAADRFDDDLLNTMIQRIDPATDGWETEVLNNAAHNQLKVVCHLLEQRDWGALESDATLFTEDFACSLLGGWPVSVLNEVFNDRMISVHRSDKALLEEGREQRLANALKQLTDGLGSEIRAEFTIFDVDQAPDSFATRLYFEVVGQGSDHAIARTATWHCRWTFPDKEAENKPRLKWIELERYEQVRINTQPKQLFVDCTESVMAANDSYRQQVLPGINHWLGRISRQYMSLFGHHGLAVGDVNGDRLDDLYVCDAGGLPNRLYVQRIDGTVVDMSHEAGVDWLDDSAAALLIDLDNDGDQDLVVATDEVMLFSKNNGKGRFTLMGEQNVVAETYSICAGDYDDDSDLDLYVCGYNPVGHSSREGLPMPVPYHDANNGGSNRLLRNEGHFAFTDVTQQTGLAVNNTRYSFAASWEDYDNDGDLDLYVANDFGRNNLYRNDEAGFTDVASEAGVADVASGMSVSWGDANRDGLMDLYIGNMFSAAGNRVAYEDQFASATFGRERDPLVAQLQRMARGNTLFLNAGNGRFNDVSESAVVNIGRWAWSSRLADLNNDGHLDLVVANGYVSTEDTSDL